MKRPIMCDRSSKSSGRESVTSTEQVVCRQLANTSPSRTPASITLARTRGVMSMACRRVSLCTAKPCRWTFIPADSIRAEPMARSFPPLFRQRALEHDLELQHVDGLSQIRVGSLLGGVAQVVEAPVGGEENDGQIRLLVMEHVQQL